MMSIGFFSLNEEVHQISGWFLADENPINIKKNDIFLNLECLKVENIAKAPTKANYEDGLVIQLSNIGCLFGYKSSKKNLTEVLLREAAKAENIPVQTGFIKDSCDSRPISYLNRTPNIATLTVPNKNKHNSDEKGRIAVEGVYEKDVVNIYKMVKTALKISEDTVNNSKAKNHSEQARKNDAITDVNLMEKKARLNERLSFAYQAKVKRGYFYPQNARDWMNDYLGKIALYAVLIIQKLRLN